MIDEELGRFITKALQFKEGKCRLIGKQYTYSSDEIVDAIESKLKMFNRELVPVLYACEKEVKNWINTKMDESESDDEEKKKFIFNKDVLEQWLSDHKDIWKISVDGKTITRFCNDDGGIPLEKDLEELSNNITVSYLNSGIVVSAAQVTAVVKDYLNNAVSHGLARLVNELKYDPAKVCKTDGWLAAVHKHFQISQSFEVFSTAMKHWAWLVKRKMIGRPVRHHLWVSFQGGAGIGKSTLINRLTDPFEGFAVPTQLGKVLDSTKEIKLLTSSFILNMDEIAVNGENINDGEHALSKDQMNVLKAILTGDFINSRVYGTQEQSRRRIKFSVISTSNDHLYDIIYDDATMRRYLEFNCKANRPEDPKFYRSLESFTNDPVGFWQGINEDDDEGYLIEGSDTFKAIDAIQKTYFPTNKTTWIWAKYLANGQIETNNFNFMSTYVKGDSHTLKNLYDNYSAFCKEFEVKQSSRPRFDDFIKHFVQAYGNNAVPLDIKSKEFDEWLEGLKDISVDVIAPELPVKEFNTYDLPF